MTTSTPGCSVMSFSAYGFHAAKSMVLSQSLARARRDSVCVDSFAWPIVDSTTMSAAAPLPPSPTAAPVPTRGSHIHGCCRDDGHSKPLMSANTLMVLPLLPLPVPLPAPPADPPDLLDGAEHDGHADDDCCADCAEDNDDDAFRGDGVLDTMSPRKRIVE